MPFPDEQFAHGVRLAAYRPEWAEEAAALATRLRELMPGAVAVEHIGSTSVSGMPAKDCLDMTVLVRDLGTCGAEALADAGFRRRPEPWNQQEPAEGRMWPKLVFAPPAGGRSLNIHVRLADAPTTRRALLFRDFLRASAPHAATWAAFKSAAAKVADDLYEYGSLKDPAWALLMELAEAWAAREGWRPAHLG